MTIDAFLKIILPKLDGWSTPEAMHVLYNVLRAETRPVNGVEIGASGGRSLITAAMAIRDGPGGKIVGYDPYTPAAAIEFSHDQSHIEWWTNKATHKRSQEQCQREVAKVAEWCELRIAQAHVHAAEHSALTYLHVDGNHEEPAVKRDLDAFLPLVAPGGLIRMDDADWPGVAAQLDRVRDVSDFVDGDAKWEIWRKR